MKKRNPLVDIFKGIAIIMVILVHSAQTFELPGGINYIPRFGQMGCQIFFLLSSFTMAYNLGGGKLFLQKRIKRLLPGYWSMIIFNFILTFSTITLLGKNILRTSDNPIDYIINLFFLNGLIPGTANNHVVLGGWFVGTLVIFYILFPLMHKLYFSLPKYRHVLFPSVISLLSFTAMYIIGELDERLYCSNNSFAYFSFVNQLPVFVLGFTLFDLVEQKIIVKHSLWKGAILLLICGWLFFSSIPHVFIVIPTLFTVAVIFLFLHYNEKTIDNNTIQIGLILKFNKYSFPIYLTHTFIVWYFMQAVLKVLKITGLYSSPTFIYLLLLPFIYFMVYYVGKYFALYLKFIDGYVTIFFDSTYDIKSKR